LPDFDTQVTATSGRLPGVSQPSDSLWPFGIHHGTVWSVAVSPDGRRLVSGGDDGVVRVWDAETGRSLRELTGHTGGVRSVAVSPDGRRLVSGGFDGVVRVWDAETGRSLRELTGHTGGVWSVAVSPDGRRLVSGGVDGVVRVWDAETGRSLRGLTGHTGPVWSVAVSPDGRRLVSGGDQVRVWDIATGEQVLLAGGDQMAGRPLAELSSDEPSERDLLGVESDVDTLAALVAAASTQAPLSIAVLGRWGAGKSSFMRQMQGQVDTLSALSRNNPGRSAFLGAVRQVRFNAWHYSDDHLWVGLVDELFRTLRPPDPDGHAPGAEAVQQERERARADLQRLTDAQQRLRDAERDLAVAPRGAGRWHWVHHPRALPGRGTGPARRRAARPVGEPRRPRGVVDRGGWWARRRDRVSVLAGRGGRACRGCSAAGDEDHRCGGDGAGRPGPAEVHAPRAAVQA
jgi:hypothetical protein